MIGIIPAAGKASRMNGLPKYLLPVPGGGHLLSRMSERIGAPCYIGANSENYDLLNAYKRENDTVYLTNSRSMPETICAAKRYAGDGIVMVGMPDTYWTDGRVFSNLENHLQGTALCAVGLFGVDFVQAQRLGMCAWKDDESGRILTRIEDKNPQPMLSWAWGALAWTNGFWKYIDERDAHMGIALQRAIDTGETIQAYLADGFYYDCATADDYFRMVRDLSTEEETA